MQAAWEACSLCPVLGHCCSCPYFRYQELAVCSTNSSAPNPWLPNSTAEGTQREAPTNLTSLRTRLILIFEPWTGSQREWGPRGQGTQATSQSQNLCFSISQAASAQGCPWVPVPKGLASEKNVSPGSQHIGEWARQAGGRGRGASVWTASILRPGEGWNFPGPACRSSDPGWPTSLCGSSWPDPEAAAKRSRGEAPGSRQLQGSPALPGQGQCRGHPVDSQQEGARRCPQGGGRAERGMAWRAELGECVPVPITQVHSPARGGRKVTGMGVGGKEGPHLGQ